MVAAGALPGSLTAPNARCCVYARQVKCSSGTAKHGPLIWRDELRLVLDGLRRNRAARSKLVGADAVAQLKRPCSVTNLLNASLSRLLFSAGHRPVLARVFSSTLAAAS